MVDFNFLLIKLFTFTLVYHYFFLKGGAYWVIFRPIGCTNKTVTVENFNNIGNILMELFKRANGEEIDYKVNKIRNEKK